MVRDQLDQTAGPALGAILDALSLTSLTGDTAIIQAPAAHVALARSRGGQIEAAFAAALGRPVRVEIGPADDAPAQSQAPDPAEAAAAMEHPLVKQAMEVFDARVVGVASSEAPSAEESA